MVLMLISHFDQYTLLKVWMESSLQQSGSSDSEEELGLGLGLGLMENSNYTST